MSGEERAKLQADVGRLEGELAAAKIRLYRRSDAPTPSTTTLEYWSWWLWFFLVASVLITAALAAVVLLRWTTMPLADLSLASAVGILGAGLSGLISLNDRVAKGWEFEDGTRDPDPAEKKERFNLRMSKGFLARPLLGLVSGPLVLAGVKLGQFVQDAVPPQAIDDRYRILFFCILGGLFSKTLFDWLKDVFKNLLGK